MIEDVKSPTRILFLNFQLRRFAPIPAMAAAGLTAHRCDLAAGLNSLSLGPEPALSLPKGRGLGCGCAVQEKKGIHEKDAGSGDRLKGGPGAGWKPVPRS